ncbi:MAG: hypothetical protein Q3988_01550 [Gemella sp.]|nr:hypothetical protein [Gemella sp.]
MARKLQPKTRIRKDDRNFRRDVIRAKMEYRKRRTFIILTIAIIALSFIFIRTYFYSMEKANLENNLKTQEAEIVKLQNDAKVNEILIAKLKDPNFIIDFVRQEYFIGYKGEMLFSMPTRENYLENAKKSIMAEDLDKQLAEISQMQLLDESKIKTIMQEKEEERKKLEEAQRKLADEQKEKTPEEILKEELLSESGVSTEAETRTQQVNVSRNTPATTSVVSSRTSR